MSLILYHAPPSFYSQIARLVLAEKRVPYRAKLAAAGPPLFETYAPWYVRLNPNGTVPTLVDGEVAIPDSRAILAYVDANFEGPSLTPDDSKQAARMQATIATLYEISVRELSYGSERMARIGLRVNAMRARRLRALAGKHADLREVYQAKLRDIEGFSAAAADRSAVDEHRRRLAEAFDELDRTLADHEFVAGSSYSLADVVATVTVARALMLGDDPLTTRRSLAAWFARMRARPSFAEADVWDRFAPSKLIAMLLRKLGLRLLVVLGLLALIGWGLWRLLA